MSGIGFGRFLILTGFIMTQALIGTPSLAASTKLSMTEAKAAALEKEEGKVVDIEKFRTNEDEVLVFFIEKADGKVMKVEVGRGAGKVLNSQLDYIKTDTPLPEGSIKQSQAREIAKSHALGLGGMSDRAVIVGAKLNLYGDKPVYHFKVSVGKVIYDVKVAPEDGKVLSAVKQEAGIDQAADKPRPPTP